MEPPKPKPSSEKTTVSIDQFAILRGLIERASTRAEAVHIAKRILGAVEELVGRVSTLETKGDDLERHQSNASLEHEAQVGLALGEVRRLEEKLDDTNDALAALVEQHGIANRTKLGNTSHPPPLDGGKPPKPPTPALEKIDQTNKTQSHLQIITLILLLLLEALRRIHL